MLLREIAPRRYRIIGQCFIYGLHDATAILGPLPAPWRGRVCWGFRQRTKLEFWNTETQESTDEDPRLGDLGDWERVDHVPEPDDPEIYAYFRNRRTEEVMNSDPRMLPEQLDAMGVELTTFALV
jgi:hypothetical protein